MTEKIQKFLSKLDVKTHQLLRTKILQLKKDPQAMKDCKKLKGYSLPTFRLRIGKIRIIYRIFEGDVEIIDIDYRGNIY